VGCLWNAQEGQDFPVLDFCGRATTAPCGGEDSSRGKEPNSEERRKGDWVYTGPMPGAKMEIPARNATREREDARRMVYERRLQQGSSLDFRGKD
jgi:hypothetical protein